MRNLRQTASGWQKYTRVRHKGFVSEHTTEKPSVLEVRNWVRSQHTSDAPPKAVQRGSFPADVELYLASVTDMPSYVDRVRDMQWWAARFPDRQRNSITALEIKTHLVGFLRTHAPGSCDKKRTALMSFFTALNGRSGYNPTRDVPRFEDYHPEPRDQPLWVIYRILALMRPSPNRCRLRVMLWTGWPHAQIARLKPEHLDLKHARAYVTPRRKGAGRKGVWLPLLPGAVIALREFIALDCFGPFGTSATHSKWDRAQAKFNARRARHGHPPVDIRPYDLRHSFGTMVAERTTDDRAIQELMMHSSVAQTRRYTERATEQRVASAIRKVADALQIGRF
jgi:integrase